MLKLTLVEYTETWGDIANSVCTYIVTEHKINEIVFEDNREGGAEEGGMEAGGILGMGHLAMCIA